MGRPVEASLFLGFFDLQWPRLVPNSSQNLAQAAEWCTVGADVVSDSYGFREEGQGVTEERMRDSRPGFLLEERKQIKQIPLGGKRPMFALVGRSSEEIRDSSPLCFTIPPSRSPHVSHPRPFRNSHVWTRF